MNKKIVNKRIAISFDGIITYPGVWPHCGRIQPGAKEVLAKLRDQGFYIIVHSTRNNPTFKGNEDKKLLMEMKDFLDKNKIPYDKIDTGEEGKPICEYFVGTRNIKFTGWDDLLYILLYGRPYTQGHKKKKDKCINKNSIADLMDSAGDINE